MTLRVLVIDDQLARDEDERDHFMRMVGELVGLGADQRRAGQFDVTFCSGQRQRGDFVENEVSIAVDAVGEPAAWNLVLLDIQFDSGPVRRSGAPKGQSGGDTFFGLEIEAALLERFPDLPIVRFTTRREDELGQTARPYLAKLNLNPHEFRKTLLLHGKLSLAENRVLLQLDAGVCVTAPSMIELYSRAMQLAQTQDPILILGESGTGKELLAKYIHNVSGRRDTAFIPVNVAAIPEQLIDSELFGYERGAFTGADRVKRGYFEQAGNGTIFLDEIGDMPLDHQLRLLRVIQERQFRRVGSQVFTPFDARAIFATHQNLQERIAQGLFREDLLNRLTLVLTIPPLRERREEILPLAEHLLGTFCEEAGKEGLSLDVSARQRLVSYDFPGNVRELAATIKAVVIETGNNRLIRADDLRLGRLMDSQRIAPDLPPRDTSVIESISEPVSSRKAIEKITLSNLPEVVASVCLEASESAIRGVKARLDEAINALLLRCAVAALERCKHPITGKYKVQPAMQLLTGDANLSGTDAKRILNEILGRKKNAPLAPAEIEALLRQKSRFLSDQSQSGGGAARRTPWN